MNKKMKKEAHQQEITTTTTTTKTVEMKKEEEKEEEELPKPPVQQQQQQQQLDEATIGKAREKQAFLKATYAFALSRLRRLRHVPEWQVLYSALNAEQISDQTVRELDQLEKWLQGFMMKKRELERLRQLTQQQQQQQQPQQQPNFGFILQCQTVPTLLCPVTENATTSVATTSVASLKQELKELPQQKLNSAAAAATSVGQQQQQQQQQMAKLDTASLSTVPKSKEKQENLDQVEKSLQGFTVKKQEEADS